MDTTRSPEEVCLSYQTRDIDFEDDDGHTNLGQKNIDGGTRTKIMHIEGLGFGIIGKVLCVRYGTWRGQHAMLILMRFNFRSKDGIFKLKRAEISLCFESRGDADHAQLPVLRDFYPRGKTSVSNAVDSSFKIQGQLWSRKDREDFHQVFWTISDIAYADSGLPDGLNLAAVVQYQGPFQGIIEVNAKTTIPGSRYLKAPWSADDPLLFDGVTQKGVTPVKTEFDTLTEKEWSQYIYESNGAYFSASGVVDTSTAVTSVIPAFSRYTRPETLDEFHIAVLCALRNEQTAVEACFDEFWDAEYSYVKAPGDKNSYTLGRIGNHNVVLAHMSRIGNSSAASVASSLKLSFRCIKFALVVGICGGVPIPAQSYKPEIWLGDVVISTGIVQHDLGSREPMGFKRKDTLESNLGPLNAEIRNVLVSIEDGRNYGILRDRVWCQLPALRQKLHTRYPFRYPGLDEDKLFEASYIHKHHGKLSKCTHCRDDKNGACQLSQESPCAHIGCDLGKLKPRDHSARAKGQNSIIQAGAKGDMLKPDIHFGIIASGNQVMKSGEHRDAIAKETGAVAFEMEGAGVWDLFPCVVIKGVCDYSDSHKNYDWQSYSALTAAACLKAFLYEWSRQNPEDRK